MKKVIVTALGIFALATTAVSSFAAAPKINWGGASATGQYIEFAKEGCSALGKIFDCVPVVTEGSGDNKDQLIAGTLDIALGMGGLAQKWAANDPEFQANVEVVRYIAGEPLFAYGKPEVVAALVNWEGVKQNGFLVSFGAPSEQSGDYLTLKELQKGEGNGLAEATVTPMGNRDAQIKAVLNDEVQLGFAAQFANPSNDFFTAIADNNLEIMPVIDTDLALTSDLYGVREVQVENVSLKRRSLGKKVETMYVPIAIMARKASTYDNPRDQKIQQAVIDRIKNMDEADLLPKVGWLTDFMNKSAKYSADKLETMGKAMKEAAKEAKAAALGN